MKRRSRKQSSKPADPPKIADNMETPASPSEILIETEMIASGPESPIDSESVASSPSLPSNAENPSVSSSAPIGADRRTHPRYEFFAAAEVVPAESGARMETRVRDLSEQGCYVDPS